MSSQGAHKEAADHLDLAAMRTLMAADRSLMAWVRTSLSMLSFGFTIYKVLEGFQQAGRDLPRENTPRNAGIFLAVAGTLAIIMGTIEYWQTLQQLRQLQHFRLVQPTFIMASVMCAAGVLLTFGIMTRVL
jgi:putative membrane protein